MNENLHLSPAGANLIKAFESCIRRLGNGRVAAYLDCVGVPTIGWGHTNHHGRKFKMGDVWSQKDVDEEFLKDMRLFESEVKRLVKVPLTQWQFDALVSFAFNCGSGALAGSSLLRNVNAKRFDAAARSFAAWNKGTVNGQKVVFKGLVRRRASESLLFQNIPDLDYDGRPDRTPVRPHEPMPQQVDPPAADEEIVKPLSKSKSVWGAIVQFLAGAGAVFAGFWEHVTTPLGFAAFMVILAVLGVGLYLVIKGRIDVQKILKQLTDGEA